MPFPFPRGRHHWPENSPDQLPFCVRAINGSSQWQSQTIVFSPCFVQVESGPTGNRATGLGRNPIWRNQRSNSGEPPVSPVANPIRFASRTARRGCSDWAWLGAHTDAGGRYAAPSFRGAVVLG
ncbi:hypothetical protein GFS60_06431 (plasmid) [Rhodococcus sp. WAY2]|nr:hypothetical protein GFS60_06431 [Rhodococcus sp. WAY2]